MSENEKTHEEKLATLRDLIKGIDFGMLTTVEEDGTLHSRPMSTNGEVEFDGDLWFFTDGTSHKVLEIEREHKVNVSYAHPQKQSYVSISGVATIVRDKAKIEELWQPQLKAWFPEGPETPGIALIKVEAERAEYWDSPGSGVAHALAFAKAIVTRQTPEIGENEKITL
ncbi:MAG TPA: pyridoxamine 5'-phosphate oxidase family protein [Abditibacteriaceae bacterium]|jgi:general stress protein 26